MGTTIGDRGRRQRRLRRRFRCGRRRFERSRSGSVRCSRKSVLRRMQVCSWKVCSEMSSARPVGCAPRRLAIPAHGGSRQFWGAGIGMLMPCATSSGTMSLSTWRMTMRCSWARQYTGSAGKITNCQIGVFAAYVSRQVMHSLIARSIFRRNGLTIQIAWKLYTCLPMSALPPSQSLRRE